MPFESSILCETELGHMLTARGKQYLSYIGVHGVMGLRLLVQIMFELVLTNGDQNELILGWYFAV